jgi:hypothetical protein
MQSLSLIAALFPDRVVVLPSAWKSAKRSEAFKHPGPAFELLWKLSNDYWDSITTGKGDATARSVFGNAYAARESEKVESNAQGRKRRSFDYKGKPVAMMKHLKIGTKDSVVETLRIHFHWDADDRRIVIGHCGPHLDFD